MSPELQSGVISYTVASTSALSCGTRESAVPAARWRRSGWPVPGRSGSDPAPSGWPCSQAAFSLAGQGIATQDALARKRGEI